MEETRNNFGRKSITPKAKKLNPRVDLSPMISLSFLLIIFFMLTSYLSKPQIMELGMPGGQTTCGGGYGGCIGDNRTMTILLGQNNKIVSYFGELPYELDEPKSLTYDKNSLRKALIERSHLVLEETGDPKKGLIVMIKPSKKSIYKNLVDVLDEMAIVKVPTYAVVDITPEELKLLN